jgi:hypothetical protein
MIAFERGRSGIATTPSSVSTKLTTVHWSGKPIDPP